MSAPLLAAALATALATAPEASAPPGDDPHAAQTRTEAKAAFDRAREHAAREEYDEAIEQFSEALRLRPSPGLHYNIAVCHHRLLLSIAEGDPSHEAHRAAAVKAYNAYLDAAPDAGDRNAVAATIQDLGGRPKTIDEWRIDDEDGARASLELRSEAGLSDSPAEPDPGLFEDDPAPAEPSATLTPPPSHPPAPDRTPMRPGFPHGMFGLGVAIEAPSPVAMARSSGVDSAPALGPALRAGGYIGDARELLLGGEFSWSSTTTPANRGHRVTTFGFLVLLEWARTVGAAGRLDLGLSNTVGLGGQTMAHSRQSPATCPVRASGVVSSRGGLLAGTRFLLRGTFGAGKRHALALRTGPTVSGFGGGSKDANCLEGGPTPFSEYGLPELGLLIRTDVSYAFRW